MKRIACILAAGTGSRSLHYPYLHKALLPINNRAVLSHCIDSFYANGIERIVIACQEGEEFQLENFIKEIHNKLSIQINVCLARSGEHVGPGKTLELCKEYLDEPFVAIGCDTLGAFNLKESGDWVTVSKELPWESEGNSGEYAYFDKSEMVIKRGLSVHEIKANENYNFFTGVIGVENLESFWSHSAEWCKNIEKPIYAGFKDGEYKEIEMINWLDTGNTSSYRYARKKHEEIVESKPGQEIFIYDSKVVKFFKDKNTIKNIANRHKLLKDICPKIKIINDHLLSYDYIHGELLSEKSDQDSINKLLNYFKYQSDKVNNKDINRKSFEEDCNSMWFEKLYSRVETFNQDMVNLDKINSINGIKICPLNELLNKIDKEKFLQSCIPCFFHGDPSPENILFDKHGNLRMIDPRPLFGKSIEIGDLFYELAKLDHALIVNGSIIRSGKYGFNVENGKTAHIWINLKKGSQFFRDCLYDFCQNQNISTDMLMLSTALTLLSICTVHTNDYYNKFLLLSGKFLLARTLNNISKAVRQRDPLRI